MKVFIKKRPEYRRFLRTCRKSPYLSTFLDSWGSHNVTFVFTNADEKEIYEEAIKQYLDKEGIEHKIEEE